MKLQKNVIKGLFLIASLIGFIACENDETMDSQSPVGKSEKLQIEQDSKLQKMLEVYKDMPIQSLFDLGNAREVMNGECVIGAVQYCGTEVGVNISRDDIIKYLGNKVITDSSGKITGVSLSSTDWHDLLNHWFTASYPQGQVDLIEKVAKGQIAACRQGYNRGHAVVLVGVDASSQAFKYYDPVLGGTDHTMPASEVYDPRLISK